MPEVYKHSRYLAELIRTHLPPDRPLIGVEVGVWKAETSRYLLSQIPTLQLTLVDLWSPDPFKLPRNQFSAMALQKNRPDVFAAWEREAMANVLEFGSRVKIAKADFRTAANTIEARSLDFAFLDAAHSYQDTMEQVMLYSLRMRPGGLLCVHDYGYPKLGYEQVRQAVDAFCGFLGLRPQVDPKSWVAWWPAPLWRLEWGES